MSRNLRFGIAIRHDVAARPDGSFDAALYADLVAQAEAMGYDHAVVHDHIFVPLYWRKVIGDVEGNAFNYFEPFPFLGYLAARTTKIELVVSCLVVPYRNPIITAKAVASVDQLSNGRFALGIVPGYMKEEFEAFNLPHAERSTMTNEFVRIMQELWTNDVASFDGKYYSFEDIELLPKCVQTPHVPIWVGGSGKHALRRVAEFGNVWHPMGFTPAPAQYAHSDELVGKPMPTGGTTPERLREDVKVLADLAGETGRDLSDLQIVLYPGVPGDEEGDLTIMDNVGKVAASGPQLLDWLGTYADAGATGFVVVPSGNTPEQCTDELAKYMSEVIECL